MFVLSGPSGAGKGTLREHALSSKADLVYSVSCTTRPPRAGELDGREYHFMTRSEFEQGISQGLFLEYAHVHDGYYGTLRQEVVKELDAGRDVLLEIDVQGAMQIKERMPEAVLVFVDIPSVEELERRLRDRHTETEQEIQHRLANARRELEHKGRYDFIVMNDNLEDASRELRRIFS